MTIHLTAEQERRIKAVIHGGAYQSIEDVVEAAVTAVEQRATQGFDGTENELEAALLPGMDSPEVMEDEFWTAVNRETDALLAGHEASRHS